MPSPQISQLKESDNTPPKEEHSCETYVKSTE